MYEEGNDRTKRPTGLARCILSTSKGEKALTIADVDHVIDSVVDRTSADDKQGQVLIAFGLHAFVLVLVISATKLASVPERHTKFTSRCSLTAPSFNCWYLGF
jgi:hypothetical protein